ncbi:pyridoxamine 5'-phosphate oxidase family protein [Nocardiopsis halophila]|uniref:pyridoxamine 5'-phosphate oxidase family protein n=1 Tax=Nocardiopsis halophila TaxID=141692 RepID=UPI0003492255|nr:pyridoxamine 5'-phosphate oxidase family protein [Nocardiopsis halophila]
MKDAPPRGRAERIRDTRAKLEEEIDLWVSTSSPSAGPYLVPLSFMWDGETLLLATSRASVTGRNLLTDGRARMSLGGTRDVVVIDGTADPVENTEMPSEIGDAFADKCGFEPRDNGASYLYFRVRPQRIQAWREVNEVEGRDLMLDGRWLDGRST